MLSQADGLSQLAVMRCLRTAVWIKQSQQLDAERTYETDVASTGQTDTPSRMPKRPAAAMEAAPAGPVPLRRRPVAALAAAVGAAVLGGAPVRRRLRGKQPPADYMELPCAPAAAAAPPADHTRWNRCKGHPGGNPCCFAADGSGGAADGHQGRGTGRCSFCDAAKMEAALATPKGRGNIVRMLKHWYQHARPIFEAAFSHSTLTEVSGDQRAQLRAQAAVPTAREVLERRGPVLAAVTPQERQAYEAAVQSDREYVRRKFFPARKRVVRHAAMEWSHPMTEEWQAQIEDAAAKDAGLPAASASPAATALEKWCKHASWDLCRTCASVQPRHLKEEALKKQDGNIIVCKNCVKAEAKRAWVPQPEDVPEPLRGLSREELEALRPLDIDSGPVWKGEYGYYFHSSMIRFAWAEQDVEDKIRALDRRSRKKAQKARYGGHVREAQLSV